MQVLDLSKSVLYLYLVHDTLVTSSSWGDLRSAVVAAYSEEDAKTVPVKDGDYAARWVDNSHYGHETPNGVPFDHSKLIATKIGIAAPHLVRGPICCDNIGS